jgi:hypothetical protein
MRRSRAFLALLASFAIGAGSLGGVAACSSDAVAPIGTPPVAEGGPSTDPGSGAGGEAGVDPRPDGGVADASNHDAAHEGGAPNYDILGTLASGACGVVQTELTQAAPSLENNLLVFVAGETYDRASLSPGGQALFDIANAGGSSVESEVMSFEVLHFCEGATLLKSETQISYEPPSDAGANTITDILVEIGGAKVGVSVTRAYHPPGIPYTDADAKSLLEKKLIGVNRSSQRVLPQDKWVKQILHVLSVDQANTDAIARVWPTIDPAIRADTIVLVTQTKGGGFVYCHPTPPLGSECQ